MATVQFYGTSVCLALLHKTLHNIFLLLLAYRVQCPSAMVVEKELISR